LPPKLVDEVIGSFPGMVARNLPVGFPPISVIAAAKPIEF